MLKNDCINTMQFSSNNNIHYSDPGSVIFLNCGFNRLHIYEGNGGVIFIQSIRFILAICECWFFSCVSKGDGACIYYSSKEITGCSQCQKCCASNCFNSPSSKGAFEYLYLKNSINTSKINDCSIIQCFNTKGSSCSMFCLNSLALSLKNSNISSSYVHEDHSIVFTEVFFIDFQMVLFNQLKTGVIGMIYINECDIIKSKYLSFINNTSLYDHISLLSLWYTVLTIENSTFMSNTIKLFQISQGSILIKNSCFYNQKTTSLEGLTMIDSNNVTLSLKLPDPFNIQSCYDGQQMIPTQASNKIDINYALIISIIIIVAISASTIYWFYIRLEKINRNTILNQAVFVDFG